MLIVLSPAKSLNFETAVTIQNSSIPEFLDQSQELVNVLKKYTPARISKLMKISDKLAALNVARYSSWSLPFNEENSKPAMLTFNGDVYRGLDASTLNQQGLDYAQQRIRILSGLYGILKPLDLMQPYRLEMGSHLKVKRSKGLYKFWGDQLQQNICRQLAEDEYPTLVNLASKEYFTSLKLPSLPYKVITPTFRDWKNGQYKFINFFAKKARGLMSRYAIDHQVEDPLLLKDFDYDGYQFDDMLSTDSDWVFTRKQ